MQVDTGALDFTHEKLYSPVPFFAVFWSFDEFERAPNRPNGPIIKDVHIQAVLTGKPLEELGPLDYDPVAEEQHEREASAWHAIDFELAVKQLLPPDLLTDANKNKVEQLYEYAIGLSGSQAVALNFVGVRLVGMGIDRHERIEAAREFLQELTLSAVKQRFVTDVLGCA